MRVAKRTQKRRFTPSARIQDAQIIRAMYNVEMEFNVQGREWKEENLNFLKSR